jgi:F-type H+-transporting ATPase subunit a
VSAQVQAINITPGEHIKWHLFGVLLNGDTITATLVAGAIILLLGFLIRRKASAREPTKLQLAFESVTEEVEKQVESSMGVKTAPFVVPDGDGAVPVHPHREPHRDRAHRASP